MGKRSRTSETPLLTSQGSGGINWQTNRVIDKNKEQKVHIQKLRNIICDLLLTIHMKTCI